MTSSKPKKETPAEVRVVFAQRLREARDARRWTQQQLADAVAAIGARLDRTTIAKLEKGQREAHVKELVSLAAALDVSPMHLLLPWRLDAEVKLAPKLTVDGFDALKWASGQRPLAEANRRTYDFMAPGVRTVVWKPGEPGSRKYGGGGITDEEALQMVLEVERHDRKKEANDAH